MKLWALLRKLRLQFKRIRLERVPEAMTRGQVVTMPCLGTTVSWLITNPGDEIQSQQMRHAFYEVETLNNVAAHLVNVNYIYDVGANIGNHSVYFAARFKPRTIVLVEPYPPAIQHLLANLSLNYASCFDLQYLGFGVSAGRGRATLIPPSDFNIGLTRLSESSEGSVNLISLDEIIGPRPADLIKIDVEGMEMDVLHGMAGTLETHRPSVFVEVTDKNKEEVFFFFKKHDYELVYSDRPYQSNMNCLFKPSELISLGGIA